MSGQLERAWSAGCAAAKLLAVAAALIVTLFVSRSHAALRDSFEGPVPSWQPTGNSDVRHRLDHHARVRGSAHSGDWSERVRLTAGNGSYVHIRHAIGHALVIDELKPSVWVNANSPGVQLLAHVVLPRTLDPKSGKPMTLLLGGAVYNRTGSWQRLVVGQLPKLLERQVRVMRSQVGPHVDAREAYVDSVVLNVYGGRGTTDVLIDDLEVEGIVGRGPAAPSVELSPPIASRLPMDRNTHGQPRFRMDGAVLRFGNQPVLVRMIEHNGEPLAWLRSLGFNAVRLHKSPRADLLAEAKRAGVWVVCPPPTIRSPKGGVEIGAIDKHYDGVLAWHLGSGLVGQNYPQFEQITHQLRKIDAARRPIACQAEAGLAEYSRLADVLMLDRRPIGTSLELVDYEVWLRERQQLARAGTMFWAKIQTQLAPALEEQLRFMTEGRVQNVPVDGVQIRSLLAMALASGVRGFSFQSSSRLDAKDYASKHRTLTLELVNMQLELFESTVTEGGVAVHAPSSDRALSAAVLGHPRKSMRLILPIRRASGEQLISSRPRTGGVSVTVPGVPDSNQAYRVSPAGLDLLERKRRTGGLRIALDRQTSDMPVLLTDDPLVVERLTAQLRRHSARAARVQRDLAAMRLAAFEVTTKKMPATEEGASPYNAAIAESRKALAASDAASAGRDSKTAFLYARGASDQIGDASRQTWQSLIAHCDSAVSMPLAMTEATLPDAARHLPKVANAPLSANLLQGGDFKDLATMMRVGWRHYRQSSVSAATSVDLVRTPGGRQGTCLVLRATPPAGVTPRLVETPPVWVTSPPVVVSKGGLVRIEGQIYIPHAITGSVDGLLIAESIGGEALAYRTGQTDGWQHFTLYRVATKSGPITLTIALTGLGEAWIDDLTIRAVGGQ